MFANVKNKIKLPKKKDKAVAKIDKKAIAKFYEEHFEEFQFFVKYYPVFQNIAIKVGELIYQCDEIAENSLEFIETLCDIVGYKESEVEYED